VRQHHGIARGRTLSPPGTCSLNLKEGQNVIISMENEKFHNEQAEAFIDYAGKSSDTETYQLFGIWAKSKDFCDIDREMVWSMVRDRVPRRGIIVIEDMDDQCMRVSAVLDLLLYEDQKHLEKTLQQQEDEITGIKSSVESEGLIQSPEEINQKEEGQHE
jgi:hypothetical protein